MADINQPAPEAGQPVIAPVENGAVAPAPQPAAISTENDRTAQEFQKLVQHNQQLKQQLELYQANETLRQQFNQRAQTPQYQQPVQSQVQQTPTVQQAQAAGVDPRDFIEVDPATGNRYVNEDKLKNRVNELEDIARSSAQRFEQYVGAQQQREIQRMESEAYAAHPDLNPTNPGYDREFNKLTRALIYDSMVNPQDYGGQAFTFKQAADVAKSKMSPAQPMANQTPEPNQAVDAVKAQATNLVPNAQPQLRDNPDDEAARARLQYRSRQGDIEAIAQRLAGIDHKGTPKSGSDAS